MAGRSPQSTPAATQPILDRGQSLEAIASAPPWSRYQITDPRVVRLGSTAAVVVYTVRAKREAQAEFTGVISSTYVRDDGKWQLAFHQQSPAA